MRSLLNHCARTALCGLTMLGLGATSHAGEVAHPAEGHAQSPVWSPNGKFLSYEVNQLGAGAISLFVSPMEGSIAGNALGVKLPGVSGPIGGSVSMVNATWHPQGYLIFSGSNEEGKYRVYMTQPPNIAASELLAKTQAPGDLSFPAVSNDAGMVAFVSDQTGDGDIRVYESNTGQVKPVTTSSGAEVYPTFSLDGQSVLYNRKVNMQLDIYSTNLATQEATKIVRGSGDQSRPVVSKNGDIVFFSATNSEGPWSIVATDGAGENKRVIASGVRLPYSSRPAVSPDGQWVAFTYDNPTKANSVFIAKLDGSKEIKEITTDLKACAEPAMGLQSGRVMLAFTALPSGEANWRKLQVVDISQHF